MADGKNIHKIVTEQQKRLILLIPGVDQAVAQQKMLRNFGCGETVLTATAEELTEVELGAQRLRRGES